MPRRKKKNQTLFYVRNIILGLFVVFIIVVVYKKTMHFFLHSDVFQIREITIDPSLNYVSSRTLAKLKGNNIFRVDLKYVQRHLQSRYPNISDLKVMRRFPDRIEVTAHKREPALQFRSGGTYAVVDTEGVVMIASGGFQKDVPLLEGLNVRERSVKKGYPVNSRILGIALTIIKEFGRNEDLKDLGIVTMDVTNLSKIIVVLSNDLKVIMDRESIRGKLADLGLVLSQGRIDLETMAYIDLRFKEPIIGKKQP